MHLDDILIHVPALGWQIGWWAQTCGARGGGSDWFFVNDNYCHMQAYARLPPEPSAQAKKNTPCLPPCTLPIWFEALVWRLRTTENIWEPASLSSHLSPPPNRPPLDKGIFKNVEREGTGRYSKEPCPQPPDLLSTRGWTPLWRDREGKPGFEFTHPSHERKEPSSMRTLEVTKGGGGGLRPISSSISCKLCQIVWEDSAGTTVGSARPSCPTRCLPQRKISFQYISAPCPPLDN